MVAIKQINIKNRSYYFYNDIIDLEKFKSNLLKIGKKSDKGIGIYNIGYVAIKKIDDCKIFTLWILCICLLLMQTYIKEKGVNK